MMFLFEKLTLFMADKSFELHHGRVIIISSGRSGSSLLVNYLNSSRNVHCHGEILSSEHGYGKVEGKSTAELRAHVVSFFGKRATAYVGAKFLTHQFEELKITIEDVLEVLREPKVLLLYRSKLLETYVSLLIAQENNIWYSSDRVNRISVPVSKREFLDYVSVQRRRWQRCLEGICGRVPLFCMTYEELVEAPRETMDQVFAFLDVPPAPIYTKSVKQNPQSLREKVSNYDVLDLESPEMSRLLYLKLPSDCMEDQCRPTSPDDDRQP
jgi:LPS sulfotransferase NodH